MPTIQNSSPDSTPTGAHGAGRHPPPPPLDVPAYDDVRMPVVLLIGVIAAVSTVLLIALVEGLTYHWQMRYIRERSYDVVDRPVEELVARQRAALQAIPERRIISIDEAIDRVLAEVQQQRLDQQEGQ